MAVISRQLGLTQYDDVFEQMKSFTTSRNESTPDELWLTQHAPVFTQGQAGEPEHLINPHNIKVVQSDRGGQVTYHGPGQLVLYFLVDIKRLGIGVRQMVSLIEQTIVDTLAIYDVSGEPRADAPGVYVNEQKIASLGLRVRNGRTYHGVALNVAMDLTPFSYINPCGYQGLKMTQLSDLADCDIESVRQQLIENATQQLAANSS